MSDTSRHDPSAPLGDRFIEAVAFAARLHAHQVRKGTDTPYLAHLMGVCALVLEDGGTEDEAIGALLHDAIEDHPRGGATRREIGERFGRAVLDIVLGCTDAEVHPKPPWRQRKEAYLAHLRTAPPAELRVTAADKLHNARAIVADRARVGERVWDRFTVGREQVLWYYRELATALRAVAAGFLIDELERTVALLEQEARGTSDSRGQSAFPAPSSPAG